MQLFERKSYTRLAGFMIIGTYCLLASYTVIWLRQPMPDIPPIASGTIALLYGMNKASKQNAPTS